MNNVVRLIGFISILIIAGARAKAHVKLPAVFGDNLVLQQQVDAPIWGWADPNEEVRITVSWQTNGKSTKADKNGNWQMKISTPRAGGPYTIVLQADNTITLKDVLIGEVWVCTGQSNMALQVNQAADANNEIAAANYPNIRLFTVKTAVAEQPQNDCSGTWQKCRPETIADFSAVAYYFGCALHKELTVPIGLIHASRGGSPAEAWTPAETIKAEPDFLPILARYERGVADFNGAKREHARQLQEWERTVKQAKIDNVHAPSKPYYLQMDQTGPGHFQSPSGLYNAMIAPLIPYRIQGVIWYQGECNTWRAWQYRKLFPAMIASWRNAWNQGEFPFYYVQIAPFDYSVFDNGFNEPIAAELREAQAMALAIPNTGMAVTMDIADPNNIHPENKQDVGKRLALWALAKTYGRKGIVYSGPIYRSKIIEDKGSTKVLRLLFDHTGSGLMAKGGKMHCFTVAGKNNEFVNATAEIEGNTVVVSCKNVKDPLHVRYAWSNTAVSNLFNKEGLPAWPFRTDDRECVTANRK